MPRIVDHVWQQQALAATAVEAIAHSGLENTTLRTVAARHGCTKGKVQHYFADKDALLLAALELVEDRFDAGVAAAAADLGGLERVHALLHAQLPISRENRRDWRVRLAFYCQSSPAAEMADTLSQLRSRQHGVLLGALRRARRCGELRAGLSPPGHARSLLAILSGLAVNAQADSGRMSAAAQCQVLRTAIDNLRS